MSRRGPADARFKRRASVHGAMAAKKGAKKSATKRGAPTKATTRAPPGAKQGAASAAELIDARIAALSDWRGPTLARMRRLIREADPDAVEEWKWEVPVWSHDGILCTGETYKEHVKLTFAKGAFLPDPARLFNATLDGNLRRAIDLREGDVADETAFKALVQAAAALNASKSRR